MAARKSTRKRSRARSHRPLRSRRLPGSGPGACSDLPPIRKHLEDLLRGLKLVLSVVSVAVDALRHQNADGDEDVALVLQRAAGDRLDIEIEKGAELLGSLGEGSGRSEDRQRAA